MGLFGSAGLKSAASSVSQIIAALVGQDIVARSLSLTQVSGSIALQLVNGARLKLGNGAADYLTSDGTSVSFAGPVILNGAATTTNITDNGNFWAKQGYYNGGASPALMISPTAPTIVAGAGASVVASNGSGAFRIDLGAAAQTGTITLPTATTGWVVYMQNITTPASFVLGQTGTTTTTATFTNYSRVTGLAINWGANDNMVCLAMAY